MISHLGYQLCRLIGVAWIDDGTTKDGAQHGQILERHLRRSILANRDTCVRTTEADVGTGDGSHTDKVIGTREECGKGRSEGYLMAYAHAHCCSHQLLFGNILFEKAIRIGFGKLFSIGRVAYLAVQPNDLRIGGAKGHECVTIGFASGYWIFAIVTGQFHWFLRRLLGRLTRCWFLDREGLAAYGIKLFDGLLFLLLAECFPMPTIFIFQE